MHLIHYSNEIIESLEHREYNQAEVLLQAKPNGLWVSVGDDWKEWCEGQPFQVENLVNAYEITLNENANILHLQSAQEIFEFTKQYPLRTRNCYPEWDTYQLQWDKVKEKYQGIIISPYQWDCRLALESSWYYGWDCASGCIWDLKCIESFKKKEA